MRPGRWCAEVEPGLPHLEGSQGEGWSEASQTIPFGCIQCLVVAKPRSRLVVVWKKCRMDAVTAWPGEGGSGKQMSESETRVKTPRMLGGQSS